MQTVTRLYETFQPTEYTLKLHLDRKARKFSGSVDINGDYVGTGPLQLHAKDLTITSARVDNEPIKTRLAEDDQLVLETTPAKGSHHIAIEFSGTITDPMHGLYPCYFEHEGVKKELLATQFESHHAREVFPCIDEPEAKAVFKLELETETDITVLANMPEQSHSASDGILTTIFEPSPRMSPYLLAFVVGELHKLTATTNTGVEVNVWATPVQPDESLTFALDTAVKSIEFFNEYFDTPYPLPKCDHVALPDFSSGAMENWGLITYREVCLLADKNTGVSTREFVAEIIAHETSHQWFGNLVTMKWWDDLWLNESFATLMSYTCVDAMFPHWNFWMTFATNETLSAVRRDYLPSVQPVKTAVNHPDEISTLFDPSIVYAKGARLLAMLQTFVGEDAFREGLKTYFQRHAYGNTTGTNLWEALSTVSPHDIVGFMEPWLTQPGMPIVSLSRAGISQRRFVLGGSNPTPAAVWPIPLASNYPDVPALFDSEHTALSDVPEDTRINTGGRGHFITHYADDDLLAFRMAAVASGLEINPADRLTLLHDATLLARSGEISATNLFELAQAYQNETSEPVWDIIGLVIADLKRFVEDNDLMEKKFKTDIVQLARQTYDNLGWDHKAGESESDVKLRATVVSMLTYADEESVIAKGLDAFRTATELVELPGETRAIIFAIVAKHGSNDDVEHMIDAYKTTTNPELKSDIAGGLTATHDPALITRLISFITDETMVRLQDVSRWYIYLLRNTHSREATWQWLQDNWKWIVSKFASDKSYDDFARYSASAFSTYEWLERYQQFFDDKKIEPALSRAIELGVSDITARAEWIKRDRAAFFDSL